MTTIRLRPARSHDLPAIERLLDEAGLTTRGVAEAIGDFFVAEEATSVVGVMGMEVYGSAALLRSAVVSAAARGTGIGSALMSRLLAGASRRGIHDVYLLTDTAETWFANRGFARTTRDAVPAAVRNSVEFREICSEDAVVMVRAMD